MKITVAKDFSSTPGGRYIKDGKFSGEEFRSFLINKLESLKGNEKLEIDLDGGFGYGSSFLEESFGGLIRLGFSAKMIHDKIVFKSDEEPGLIMRIRKYINEATNK